MYFSEVFTPQDSFLTTGRDHIKAIKMTHGDNIDLLVTRKDLRKCGKKIVHLFGINEVGDYTDKVDYLHRGNLYTFTTVHSWKQQFVWMGWVGCWVSAGFHWIAQNLV